jgi:glycosyltransferase involved in cell wall biosynthesis
MVARWDARTGSPIRGRGNVIDQIVILEDFSVARGGTTMLSLLSAKLFRQLDIPVTYICGDDGENPDLSEIGVSIFPMNGADLLNAKPQEAFFNGIHNGYIAQRVRAWIGANDTPNTIYHVNGWAKILSPSIFAALKMVAQRCVVHAHDFFAACPNGAFFNYQQQTICPHRPLSLNCMTTACDKRSYSHKLWRVARAVNVFNQLRGQAEFGSIILLHEKMRPFFLHTGYSECRLKTIRNPVQPLLPERVKVENNDEFFFIGRLDEEKGIEDALAATRKAGVKLCVIGDGPLMQNVKAAGPDVRALGWLSKRDIACHIPGALGLLMPSRYPEPFGLVAVEAARSGVPVIMSKDAFLAEEMTAAGLALSCDTRDAAAFAATIATLRDLAPADRRQMSKRAFARASDFALEHFQWRDALLDEYRSLLTPKAVVISIDRRPMQGAVV